MSNSGGKNAYSEAQSSSQSMNPILSRSGNSSGVSGDGNPSMSFAEFAKMVAEQKKNRRM
jgi:hypothetical protein